MSKRGRFEGGGEFAGEGGTDAGPCSVKGGEGGVRAVVKLGDDGGAGAVVVTLDGCGEAGDEGGGDVGHLDVAVGDA